MTLSRKADTTAVTICSMNMMPAGLALTFLADQIAIYWNTPHLRVIATMIIMPVRSAIVLKSMPRTAAAWFSTPSTTMRPAPISATIARLTRSDMMTP